MKYYSTNGAIAPSSLEEAVLKGMPVDGGLFMPEEIRRLPDAFFHNIAEMSLKEIAYVVLDEFIGDEIPARDLQEIVNDTFSFEIPLREIENSIFSLELYYGPTGSYQDIGARFMARLTAALIQQKRMRGVVNVVVATKGDTGAAIANGFLDLPGFNVYVLFPQGVLTEMQEKEITTLRGNVHAIEVNGSFDDCVALVQSAFNDTELNRRQRLVSANSCNIARLLPQIVYYFYAYAQYVKAGNTGKPVFAVPGGSPGNLLAGLMAVRMGVPISRFIDASTIDDSLLYYLRTGEMKDVDPHQFKYIEVDDPGNFYRIKELYGIHPENIKKEVTGVNYTERAMRRTLARLHEAIDYLLDIQSACVYQGLHDHLKEGEKGIFLTGFHPAKCREYLEPVIGEVVFAPAYLDKCLDEVKLVYQINPDYPQFRKILEECSGNICRVMRS